MSKLLSNIEFAPRHVPLPRRLQTLSVLTYTFLFTVAPMATCVLFLFVLLSPLFPFALGYLAWIYYDYSVRRSSSHGGGGRRWEAVRRLRIWKLMGEYFPVHLIKTVDLDPSRNYLFGSHPHGIMGCGAFVNFGSEGTNFSEVFNGITPHLLTLKPNFKWPLLRALLLWNGVCDVSRESIEWILTRQSNGNAAIIVVGGAEEALDARPGCYNITLNNRKGFVKMAIKSGAYLVPVFSFGENDLFLQADNPKGSGLRNFQERFKRFFGFSPPLFHGRGVFNYTFGLIPFRKPVHTIVGAPIPVKKDMEPDNSYIDEVHQQYKDELAKLFEDNKLKYGVDENMHLNFV